MSGLKYRAAPRALRAGVQEKVRRRGARLRACFRSRSSRLPARCWASRCSPAAAPRRALKRPRPRRPAARRPRRAPPPRLAAAPRDRRRAPCRRMRARPRPATFPTTRCSWCSPIRPAGFSIKYPEGWTQSGSRRGRHVPRQEQPRARGDRRRRGADADVGRGAAGRAQAGRSDASAFTLRGPCTIGSSPGGQGRVHDRERTQPGDRQAGEARSSTATSSRAVAASRPWISARRSAWTTSMPTG